MKLNISLIGLIVLFGVCNVNASHSPLALYIQQRAEDALQEQLIKSRSSPMLRSSISDCHPYYSELLKNILETYEKDLQKCKNIEAEQLEALANEGQQAREATTSILNDICASLDVCKGKTENVEFFDCVSDSIVGFSVFICMANAFDDHDYNMEPREVSQKQQQSFSFENLQRLRNKLQDGSPYRQGNTINNNNERNENQRNTYTNGRTMEQEQQMLKDQESNGVQKPHQNTNNQPKFNEMDFFDEFESSRPYGIQNVRRDLSSRSSRSQPRLHRPKTTFQSLCPSKRLVIPLETIQYVYRPDHYEEVTCHHSYAPNRDYLSETNKVCSEAGFTCIQLNRTVFLTRRAKDSDCWESETRIVPSGCECMWPKHTFGDIITYH